MTCKKIQKNISRYLDGELPHGEKEIRAHLSTCPSCSAVFQKFEQVDTSLRDDFWLHADPFLLTRIKASVNKTSRHTLPAWSLVQKVLAPTTILAGLILGVFIGVKLNSTLTKQPNAEQQTHYSIIDSNIFEPLPAGSITATYVSMNTPIQ